MLVLLTKNWTLFLHMYILAYQESKAKMDNVEIYCWTILTVQNLNFNCWKTTVKISKIFWVRIGQCASEMEEWLSSFTAFCLWSSLLFLNCTGDLWSLTIFRVKSSRSHEFHTNIQVHFSAVSFVEWTLGRLQQKVFYKA